jgi:hypothetical protein
LKLLAELLGFFLLPTELLFECLRVSAVTIL